MPRYYPMMVDLTGQKCVVVGGGEVAERKIATLLKFGARVVVVSPDLSPGIKRIVEEEKVEYIGREYQKNDLKGAFLVIGATNEREVNERLTREAREEGILVNVVDSPSDCSFIVPSILNRGDLVIAISTGGKSPALAKRIRQELEGIYGPEYAELLEILGELRSHVLREVEEPALRQKIMERVTASGLLERIRAGEGPLIRQELRSLWEVSE